MFRRSYNRALVRVRLSTATPLLIRAGDTGLSPTAANLSCVRTRHGVYGATVYVPGSSMKGVVRQAAEAAVRDQPFRHGLRGACDPLNHKESCQGVARRKSNTPAVYAALCLACRTFGSLALKGRTSIRDLYPWDDAAHDGSIDRDNLAVANRVELRHGVAINRVTGSAVKGALFEQEVVPAGVHFWGEVTLENYQLWQLGLVMQALDELDAGFARLGSSTSRGLGEVRVAVESIVHEQAIGRSKQPAGVGALADEPERREYTLVPETALDVPDVGVARGLVDRFTAGDPAAWRTRALDALGALR